MSACVGAATSAVRRVLATTVWSVSPVNLDSSSRERPASKPAQRGQAKKQSRARKSQE